LLARFGLAASLVGTPASQACQLSCGVPYLIYLDSLALRL
jgi:hypothetical protein